MDDGNKEIVRSIIAEVSEIDVSQIKDESEFTNDLGIDSMMILEILALIENKLQIAITEADLGEGVQSMRFNDLMAVIDRVQSQ